MRRSSVACAALAATFAIGCQRSEGPTPTSQTNRTASAAPAPITKGTAAPKPNQPTTPTTEAPPADAAAPEPIAPKSAVPLVVDDAGAPLPQTEDRPSTDSAFFTHLKTTLFAAIQKDDPEAARALFFPIEAYRQVKNIAKPDRDYEGRLLKAYARDIHDYHARLGDHPEAAKLIDLEVPEARARWMKPGSEGNKLGYHRVLRSQLRFTDAKGKERSLEVTSLISWRGEWYVVHIHGFK